MKIKNENISDSQHIQLYCFLRYALQPFTSFKAFCVFFAIMSNLGRRMKIKNENINRSISIYGRSNVNVLYIVIYNAKY